MAKGGGAGTKAATKAAGASASQPASQDWKHFPDAQDDPASGAWLESEWKDWATNLTPEEKSQVANYQMNSDINRILATGQPLSDWNKEQIKRLDKAIAKGRVPGNIVVYRGMQDKFFPQAIKDNPHLLEGKSYTFSNYLSTSVNRNKAASFHGSPLGSNALLFRIRVPKGTPAIAPRAATSNHVGAKKYAPENEILFSRGSTLKIHKVKKRNDGTYLVDASL